MLSDPCRECGLHAGRNNLVLYRGSPSARLMFIGEAPGRQEDLAGRPFVGDAGRLLDRMLAYLQLDPASQVYVCNVLKCRPPGNRDPLPEEVQACLPYLHAQIDLVRPELFVVLGRVAAAALGLLPRRAPLREVLGRWLEFRSRPAMVVYHPAYLLRNPTDKFRQAAFLDEIKGRLKGLWLL